MFPRLSLSCSKETVTFLTSLYLGTVLNFSFYAQLAAIFKEMATVHPAFIISIPFFVVFTLNLALNLLNWRYLIKPVIILLLMSSAAVSYAMIKYSVVFDRDMIQNIFETNVAEAHAYINASSITAFALFVIPPIFLLLNTKLQYGGFWREQVRRLASMVVSVVVIAIIALFFYKDYASVGRNNPQLLSQIVPTYFIRNTYKYIKKAHFSAPVPYTTVGADAARTRVPTETKPSITVLVLGETSRSANHSLNGYARDTNRYTQQLGMISFKNVSSCGTATALSVPCMFSNLGRSNYNEQQAKNQDNALNVIQRAGINVTWLENDGGCKGVCDKVTTITINPAEKNAYCNGKTCYDEVFLPELDSLLNKADGKDALIVLHVIGSHGPTYYQRYPAEKRLFTPDCPRSDIENCSTEQLVNTYDNTIAYTDYVISKVINRLDAPALTQKYNTSLLYISDHGESLGESGLYLHGTPYSVAPDTQTQVPMMLWMSPQFIAQRDINAECLKQKAGIQAYSHDNLFHTLLGITGVKTQAKNGELDILAACQS